MPALIPTDHTATITWLGRVPHRDAQEIEGLALTEMPLGFAGAEGEVHAGLTRPSCSRVKHMFPRGTEIRNVRQLSILSEEEIAAIAEGLGLERIAPEWLGASIVLRGLPDFSHLPPSSRLQAGDGTTLTVDMQNLPCKLPALTMVKATGGQGRDFKAVAEGRRGVTAWVERPGTLHLGQELRLFVPAQRPWSP